eukprot:1983577-Pleurochrysis_carterae.AAC.4
MKPARPVTHVTKLHGHEDQLLKSYGLTDAAHVFVASVVFHSRSLPRMPCAQFLRCAAGTLGMRYSLVSRELIADSIELMHNAYAAVRGCTRLRGYNSNRCRWLPSALSSTLTDVSA